MLLWTIQPQSVYEILLTDGVFHCDPLLSENITEFQFTPAYDWLVTEMKRRIGDPPEDVKYPIWAWHTLNWKYKLPDLRCREFWFSEPMLCIEIEVPDKDVLLSDEENWHFVLNNSFYARNEKEYEEYNALQLDEQQKLKLASWSRIFDVDPYEDAYIIQGRYVQATFWELKKDMVVSVREVKKRLKS